MQAVENLLTMMSSVVHRHKKQLQLRNMCCEERVWKSHLNYSMAQAHLALLYKDMDQQHRGALQHRFTHKNPATSAFLCFSVNYWSITSVTLTGPSGCYNYMSTLTDILLLIGPELDCIMFGRHLVLLLVSEVRYCCMISVKNINYPTYTVYSCVCAYNIMYCMCFVSGTAS